MRNYYKKYLVLGIIGAIIIGVASYLFLSNYLDNDEILVAARDIASGEKIVETDLYFKEYYKNSLPENYLTDKKEIIGKTINLPRLKDDYISKDMFDKKFEENIFALISEGDVLIAIDVQYFEPILKELKEGDHISIMSTIKDKDLESSEYIGILKVRKGIYPETDSSSRTENSANANFLVGKSYLDNNTFELSDNVILIDGQIIVRNLEIVSIKENSKKSENILLSESSDTVSIYFKCEIEEAPIIARLTKEANYKIIYEG